MSEWISALNLEEMRLKWLQKRDALDVRDMMEVIALAESLREMDARLRQELAAKDVRIEKLNRDMTESLAYGDRVTSRAEKAERELAEEKKERDEWKDRAFREQHERYKAEQSRDSALASLAKAKERLGELEPLAHEAVLRSDAFKLSAELTQRDMENDVLRIANAALKLREGRLREAAQNVAFNKEWGGVLAQVPTSIARWLVHLRVPLQDALSSPASPVEKKP